MNLKRQPKCSLEDGPDPLDWLREQDLGSSDPPKPPVTEINDFLVIGYPNKVLTPAAAKAVSPEESTCR